MVLQSVEKSLPMMDPQGNSYNIEALSLLAQLGPESPLEVIAHQDTICDITSLTNP